MRLRRESLVLYAVLAQARNARGIRDMSSNMELHQDTVGARP